MATERLPCGTDADLALDEIDTASRLGCRVADLRRARFHRVGPEFIRESGRILYPIRAVEHWQRRVAREAASLAAEPLALSTCFQGDFTA